MPSFASDRRAFFSSDTVMVGASGMGVLWLLLFPSTPAQAGLGAFLLTATIWLWVISRRQLLAVRVEREHLPRVFQDDPVEVTLVLHRGEGTALDLLEIEDQFHASLAIPRHDLIPRLPADWAVRLTYRKPAERHRGLYLVGPVTLRAGDPLGVFISRRRIDLMTRLVIYPRAQPLPGYQIPGPAAGLGASLDLAPRIGQGEEVLGVREYRPGDAPSTVHWRTSARRGTLHVIQRNRPIQSEVALLMDFRRMSRYGLGAESTTELAIQTAVSILSRVHEARHRASLCYAREHDVVYPAGAGLAHLHLLLDRLAILVPEGEEPFWPLVAARAARLQPGDRAVIVNVAAMTPLERALPLVRGLVARGVAVDVALIDESEFIRIYQEQEPAPHGPREPDFPAKCDALRSAGARVWPLHRGEAPALGAETASSVQASGL